MTTWSPEDLLGLSHPSPLAVDWPAPVDVRIEGESVTWDSAATQARNGRQEVGPDLLEHFGALARAENFEAAVIEFVSDFGPLGVDDEGRPLTVLGSREKWQHRIRSLERQSEPLTAYRAWSSRVAVVLPIIGSLTTRRKVTEPDLLRFAHVVFGWTDAELTEIEDRLPDMRGEVSGLVTEWLYESHIGVGVRWQERKPFGELSMVGGSNGCLAAVLLQLALTMTRAEQAFICAGCGLPFTPRRIPRVGQRAFCDVCRSNGIPQKLATRDMRRRKAQEGASNG